MLSERTFAVVIVGCVAHRHYRGTHSHLPCARSIRTFSQVPNT